jgi:hypothetical protein
MIALSLYKIEAELLTLQEFYQDALVRLSECSDADRSECEAECAAARDEIARYVNAEVQKVDNITGFLRWCAANEQQAKAEAARVTRLQRIWQTIGENVKRYALEAMQVSGKRRLETPTSRLRIQTNSQASVVIENAQTVPDRFIVKTLEVSGEAWATITEAGLAENFVVKETSFSLSRIAAALKSGELVPGARLVKGEHLRVE